MLQTLDNYFGISRSGSTLSREIQAGVTTFLTMAYILFVNPDILSKAIMPGDSTAWLQIMSATAIAAAIGTLAMGIIARYPFATAPGMGLNAFFTFTLVLHDGLSWQTALGCVFFSGLLALFISFFGIRESIIRAFPAEIKHATAAGIGLFLAVIGCVNSGLVIAHPATLVQLGSFHSPQVQLTLLGLLVTGVCLSLKLRGAILTGILSAAFVAVQFELPVFQGKVFAGFADAWIAKPVWPGDLFLHLDIWGALKPGLLVTIFTLWFVDFFDTAGTLMGLADRAGFTDDKGNLPRGSKAFICDSLATTCGALAGTSSTTTYIESMSGIEDGGRTGLTSVVVAVLFLASLCFWPLATAIPSCATAGALIVVGSMMMTSTAKISWDNPLYALPCFLTIIAMPLTYSIANGIAFGIISFTTLHVLTGRYREVHWFMLGLTVLLVFKFAVVA